MDGQRAGVRQPTVAGYFYPADAKELREAVRGYLAGARGGDPPRAVIAPHSGYVYSAPIAASAFARIEGARSRIRRVLIVGPAHLIRFDGLALAGATALATPLGRMACDPEGTTALAGLRFVQTRPDVHLREHSIEVQLPFLQETLGDVPIVPLLTGDASPEQVAEALDAVWDETTLAVISSDLSHFFPYADAVRRDRATAEAILGGDIGALEPDSACGRLAVKGLLLCVRRRGLRTELLDLRNSGDTAGPRDRVVGYGAFAVD